MMISPVIAQDQERSLALQYYQNEDYERAAEIFERLYDKEPGSNFLYRYLFNSYILLKDYEKAEKLTQRNIRRNRNELNFIVDLGYVYIQSGQSDKAKSQFDRALNALTADERQIRSLANSFNGIREYSYAAETYIKGKELLNDDKRFNFEIAGIYLRKDNFSKSISFYLEHLRHNPNQIQQLKNTLQFRLEEENLSRELRQQLFGKIQQHPQQLVFSDMLVWLLIQNKDFSAAFRQVRAIDRRLNEDGKRVLELAQAASAEEHYETAIEAFQYVIDKGRDFRHYRSARMGLLSAMKDKLISSLDYTSEDVEKLDEAYAEYLQTFGTNRNTISTVLERSEIHAKYLYDLDRAVNMLEEVKKLPGIDQQTEASIKLQLGDYYVMRGNVWDASLLYSQVEKTMRNNPMIEEARFKNAKLSYFRGDFEWAQTQLKVLKSATSNFISNDAIELYVFIRDHLALDTTDTPIRMYAEAELLHLQNRNEESIAQLNLINEVFPNHSLAPDIALKIADIKISQREYDNAMQQLEYVVMNYPEFVKVDKALFQLGYVAENYAKNREKALEWYEELIINHYGSIYVVEARKRFRSLRGDFN